MSSADTLEQAAKKIPDETREALNFYLHHLEQVDRLLEVVELLKIENKQLRQMLHKNSPNKVLPAKSPTTHTKPRITCWTFKE